MTVKGTKYPTKSEIWELFKKLGTGDNNGFFSRVAPDVNWTVMGTSPMSKKYESLKEFQEATLSRLKPIIKAPGLQLEVFNVIGGESDAWATAEMKADAECVNGSPYKMSYAWCVRFNDDGMIEEVRAYLDTNLLQHRVQEHECPSFKAPIDF